MVEGNKNSPEPVEKVKIGGNEVKNLMAKIGNLSDIQQEIAFTEFDFYQQYVATFQTTELGRIKRLLPLRETAVKFGLVENRATGLRVKRGRKPFFTPEGKVALAFPKIVYGTGRSEADGGVEREHPLSDILRR